VKEGFMDRYIISGCLCIEVKYSVNDAIVLCAIDRT